MILAAGLGTRMRPLTALRAKPVLPVLNRPLLHWTLELLRRHGVREVMLNTHHLPGTVRRAIGDGSAFGLRVSYSHERRILGTAGGPRRARAWLGDAPFFLVNGDVLFDFDLGALLARHRAARARATLALLPNPDPRVYGAVVTGRDGRIRSISGRPAPARGTVSLFTGVHVMEPSILDRLPEGAAEAVPDLYAPLIAEGETVQGVRMRGPWYDFGTPGVYLQSQIAMLARGFTGERRTTLVAESARVHEDAIVRRSVIGKGCVVEEGARVEDSILWDRVRVGAGARVLGSVIAGGVAVPPRQVVRATVVVPGDRAPLRKVG
jgi:mannose-1-phosphate guanylyltransferase